jgi:hypothetical protein
VDTAGVQRVARRSGRNKAPGRQGCDDAKACKVLVLRTMRSIQYEGMGKGNREASAYFEEIQK